MQFHLTVSAVSQIMSASVRAQLHPSFDAVFFGDVLSIAKKNPKLLLEA